jgi:hypothetical protein
MNARLNQGYLTGQVVAAYIQVRLTARMAQLASACLRVAPPCGTEAGVFLISLKKMSFSTGSLGLTLPRLQAPPSKAGQGGAAQAQP